MASVFYSLNTRLRVASLAGRNAEVGRNLADLLV